MLDVAELSSADLGGRRLLHNRAEFVVYNISGISVSDIYSSFFLDVARLHLCEFELSLSYVVGSDVSEAVVVNFSSTGCVGPSSA